MTRTIVHLSDLHFGTAHARARAETLRAAVTELEPDVVVVSGDLTQRARSGEFTEARAFLDDLAPPKVVVPGNHDVPLWNVARRFASPLSKWRRWMRLQPTPSYVDAELAIVGIDTTRRFGVKGGRVASAELRCVSRRLERVPARACRIVVGHHPLATPTRPSAGDAAMGGRRALTRFAALRIEIILSGHLHESHVFHPVDRSTGVAGGILLVNAGTTTSPRGRGSEAHANSFNVIQVQARRIGVTTFVHGRDGTAYVAARTTWFKRTKDPRARDRRA